MQWGDRQRAGYRIRRMRTGYLPLFVLIVLVGLSEATLEPMGERAQ